MNRLHVMNYSYLAGDHICERCGLSRSEVLLCGVECTESESMAVIDRVESCEVCVNCGCGFGAEGPRYLNRQRMCNACYLSLDDGCEECSLRRHSWLSSIIGWFRKR